MLRSGIKAELSGTGDLEVVGEASDGGEALSLARSLVPDFIIMDIAVSGKDGLEVLKEIHAEMPGVRILVLTALPERQYAIRCLKGGARGYLKKDSSPGKLVDAILSILRGNISVNHDVRELLASELAPDNEGPAHRQLSDREFQILCLIGQGNSISQTARLMFLSVSSVNTYRARILSKLKLQNTAQLMRYVIDNGLTLGQR